MAFVSLIPLQPLVEKIVEKGVGFIPIIGPGLKYSKTAKKVTNFTNPVKATTYTAGMRLEICGGKYAKYTGLCAVRETTTTVGVLTGNAALIGVGLEVGTEILNDFYGD